MTTQNLNEELNIYHNAYIKCKNDYQIYYDNEDYDNIYGIIDTKSFTILDNIEIIVQSHEFISFLHGFSHSIFDIKIIHGWYHKISGNVKFIIENHPANVGDIIYYAWKEYMKIKKEKICEISIYYIDCCRLYKSEDYEINNNIFYKKFIKKLLDKIDD